MENSQSKNKKLVLVGLGIVIILGIVLLAVLPQRSSEHDDKISVSEIEGETPGTVVIDNTDRLGELLPSQQYTAVVDELIRYIAVEIDPGIVHAYIDGQTQLLDTGDISFVVKTEKPDTSFTVTVDRTSHFDKIIFSVKGAKYQQTIDVY